MAFCYRHHSRDCWDSNLIEDSRELVASGPVDAYGQDVADDAQDPHDGLTYSFDPERGHSHQDLFAHGRVDLAADELWGRVENGAVVRKIFRQSVTGHVAQHGVQYSVVCLLHQIYNNFRWLIQKQQSLTIRECLSLHVSHIAINVHCLWNCRN